MSNGKDDCDHQAVKQAMARDVDARPLPTEGTLAAFDAVLEAAGGRQDIESQRAAAKALLGKAEALSRLGRWEEVDRAVEALRGLCAANRDAVCRRALCRCLFGGIADSKRRHGKRSLEREIDEYEAIFTIASWTPVIDDVAAEALYGMGMCGAYQRPESPLGRRAHDAYRLLGHLYLSSADLPVARFVAAGMGNLARTFWPESKEAAEIWESIVAAYARSPDPALQLLAADALQKWGVGLLRRQRDAEAIAVWERSVALFGGSADPNLQAVLAGDLMNRAQAEGRLRGREAELGTYEELARRYGKSTSPVVLRWVACSETNRAITLLGGGQREEAAAVWRALIARFEGMTEPPEIAAEVAKAKKALEGLRRAAEGRKG